MSKSDVSRRDAVAAFGTVVGGVACEYGEPRAVEDYGLVQSTVGTPRVVRGMLRTSAAVADRGGSGRGGDRRPDLFALDVEGNVQKNKTYVPGFTTYLRHSRQAATTTRYPCRAKDLVSRLSRVVDRVSHGCIVVAHDWRAIDAQTLAKGAGYVHEAAINMQATFM